MKELESKREKALKEMETMRNLLTTEKRSVFNADEKAQFEKIRAEVTSLGEQIEAERFLESQKSEVRKSFEGQKTSEQKLNEAYNVGRALKAVISGRALEGAELEASQEAERELKAKGLARQNPNSILIPGFITEQRSTNTVSSQPSLLKTNLLDTISMAQYVPAYKNVGATIWSNVPNGAFAIPSLSNIIAGYAATDSTASDVSLTSAVKSLAPKWMQAAGAFTKDFLASSTDSMQTQVFGFFNYGMDRATDKQFFIDLSGTTTAALYTSATTRTYQKILSLANGVPFSTAFVSSKKGSTFLMTTPTISGTSTNALPIWNAQNQIAGVPAYASFDAPNGLYAFGNFADYHIPVWSSAYEVLIDPFTEARKGNIILQVSRCQSQGVGNPASFAIATVGSYI